MSHNKHSKKSTTKFVDAPTRQPLQPEERMRIPYDYPKDSDGNVYPCLEIGDVIAVPRLALVDGFDVRDVREPATVVGYSSSNNRSDEEDRLIIVLKFRDGNVYPFPFALIDSCLTQSPDHPDFIPILRRARVSPEDLINHKGHFLWAYPFNKNSASSQDYEAPCLFMPYGNPRDQGHPHYTIIGYIKRDRKHEDVKHWDFRLLEIPHNPAQELPGSLDREVTFEQCKHHIRSQENPQGIFELWYTVSPIDPEELEEPYIPTRMKNLIGTTKSGVEKVLVFDTADRLDYIESLEVYKEMLFEEDEFYNADE